MSPRNYCSSKENFRTAQQILSLHKPPNSVLFSYSCPKRDAFHQLQYGLIHSKWTERSPAMFKVSLRNIDRGDKRAPTHLARWEPIVTKSILIFTSSLGQCRQSSAESQREVFHWWRFKSKRQLKKNARFTQNWYFTNFVLCEPWWLFLIYESVWS